MNRKSNVNLVKRNLPARTATTTGISPTVMVGLAIVALIIWLILKSRQSNMAGIAGTYKNEESWSVQYNEDGLPTKVTIFRNAIRS